MTNQEQLPDTSFGTKPAPPQLVVHVADSHRRPERLTWPLAVLVIAILSGLGWLVVVYGIGRLIGD